MASMTRELAFQAGIRPRENRAGAGGMTECGASYALENSRDKRLETTNLSGYPCSSCTRRHIWFEL